MLRAAQDPYTELLIGVGPGDENADEYVARQPRRAALDLGVSLAIARSRTNQPVGQIGLWLRAQAPDGSTSYREEAHGRASIGYWIAPDERGHGYASAALEAVSRWALTLEAVSRLELFIEPTNEPSWRVAQRAGFHREGRLRSWQRIGETRRDMFVYSRLPDDPEPRRDAIHA